MEEPIIEEARNTELSERELEVLQLVAGGLSNKEIATQLYLSINTVKVHLRNIFAKIGVQSRMEATMVALQRGLVMMPGTPAASAASATAEALTPAPAIDIEPPLPIVRRIALIGLILFSIVLALIAGPHGSAQSVDPGQTFITDSPQANASSNPASNDTVWQAVSQMSQVRGRLATASIGSRVIAIGGEGAGGVTGLVEVLDTTASKWQIGSIKPLAVANVSAAVINGKAIVPGGNTSAGTPTVMVEAYDPISDTWSTLSPLPSPRFGYSIAAFDGKVYLFGGWDGSRFVNSVLMYDPTMDRWSQRAPMLIARGFSGAAVIGKLIYVVGGYADGREFNTCERYWPDEDRWEACAPMTVARGGLGLVSVGDRLYALGGGWTGYLTFSERYDPQANIWSVVPTPFVGQWRGMGVTTIGNDVYALGGWSGGQYLSVVEKYNPFPFNIFVPAATR